MPEENLTVEELHVIRELLTEIRDMQREQLDHYRTSVESSLTLQRKSVLVQRFVTLGALLGAWTGCVIGIKLVHLSSRRRRDDYQADRAGCVSCGRCYWYCPVERGRIGLIKDVSEMVPGTQPPPSPLVQISNVGKEDSRG